MGNDIFGIAINDYFEGNHSEDITVKAPDFDDDSIPIAYLFRDYTAMPLVEQQALQLVRGNVLDVGCGAGSHSLYLQQQKLNVTAIDISEGAIAVCKKRGVTNAQTQNIYELKHGKYDTILLLMNGCGIIGKLDNFAKFLKQLKRLVHKDGQVLLDSSNIAYLFEEEDGSFWMDTSKAYYGEMNYQLQYKNLSSDWFDWLYIDFENLKKTCTTLGWNCELIQEGTHYDYLARLSLL